MEDVEQRAHLRIVLALLQIQELERGLEAHAIPQRDLAGGRGLSASPRA